MGMVGRQGLSQASLLLKSLCTGVGPGGCGLSLLLGACVDAISLFSGPHIPSHPLHLGRFLKGSEAQPRHLKPTKPFQPGLDGQLGSRADIRSAEAHRLRGKGQLGWVRGRGGASTISAPSPERDWRGASAVTRPGTQLPCSGSARAAWGPWGRS